MPRAATQSLSSEKPEKQGPVLSHPEGKQPCAFKAGVHRHSHPHTAWIPMPSVCPRDAVQGRTGWVGHSWPGSRHVDPTGPDKWCRAPGSIVVWGRPLHRLRATGTIKTRTQKKRVTVDLRPRGPGTKAQTGPGPGKARRCVVLAGPLGLQSQLCARPRLHLDWTDCLFSRDAYASFLSRQDVPSFTKLP